MVGLTEKLTTYEALFKIHQDQVDKFFKMAEHPFDEESFPSIRVTRREPGEGVLVTLGTKYELSFRFVVLAHPTSILEVSLPATTHTDKQRLALWYVDDLGNVRAMVDSSSSLANINDRSFLVALVDRAQTAYFALVKKTLSNTQ